MPNRGSTNSDLHNDLARQVINLMRLQAMGRGDHVTETGLAKALNVSRSPVRGALNLLVEKGILVREANRGCFVNCDPQEIDIEQFGVGESAGSMLYRQIVTDYFQQDLPNEVAEAELLRRYDIGRAVLSDVLRQLFNDGLISRNPGKGWRFEPTLNTEESYDDGYRLRLIIEPAAILEPSFDLDADLARLVRQKHDELLSGEISSIPVENVFDADAMFHELIGISSRNMFIESIIKSQNRLRRVLEYQFHSYSETLEESCYEHLQILNALEKKQQSKAANLLERHIDRSSKARPEFLTSEDEAVV